MRMQLKPRNYLSEYVASLPVQQYDSFNQLYCAVPTIHLDTIDVILTKFQMNHNIDRCPLPCGTLLTNSSYCASFLLSTDLQILSGPLHTEQLYWRTHCGTKEWRFLIGKIRRDGQFQIKCEAYHSHVCTLGSVILLIWWQAQDECTLLILIASGYLTASLFIVLFHWVRWLPKSTHQIVRHP